jgi:hypothetical protein
MAFQLYKGKIASLTPEERAGLEEEARNYEEDCDAIAALKIPNLDPADPNPILLRKTLFERHYSPEKEKA